MKIAFILSMPNRASWNGKWSGQDSLYAIVKSFPNTKKSEIKLAPILEKSSWYYNFGDGWGARVEAKIVSGVEVRKIKRMSKGFCGYDWMVESILRDNEIKI